jgi:hypothetical protein
MNNNKPVPIFILSAARSGSSLLRYIIDTHPLIGCPPEFHIGQTLVLLQNTYKIILDSKSYESEDHKNRIINNHVYDHLNTITQHYCASVNKEWWCEKSIYSIDYIEQIKSIFPDAKFICLYRNCLDQVGSSMEVMQRFDPSGANFGFTPFLTKTIPNVESGLVDYWTDKTVKMLKIEAKYPKDCFKLTYESIVKGKKSTFKQLFGFIGLDWDSALLEKVFTTHHTVGPGDPKIGDTNSIHSDSVGRGEGILCSKLTPNRIKAVNKIHQRLGYKKLKM